MGFDLVGDVGRRARDWPLATPLPDRAGAQLADRALAWLSRKAQTRLDGAPASGSLPAT
ncbi:hypothetical protein P4114_25400 [Pseudomonas aeruginosa]|nr:hypothetical protein [Pseudomonas aeruginosa]